MKEREPQYPPEYDYPDGEEIALPDGPIVDPESWVDAGTWVGVMEGDEGGWVCTQHVPTHGWFVSVLLDSEGGSFCMVTLKDDGPYASEAKARSAGRDHVCEWLVDNGLPLPD